MSEPYTPARRERQSIVLLNYWLDKVEMDKLHADETKVIDHLVRRVKIWRLRNTEFYVAYSEMRESPGWAFSRLRYRPYPSKNTGDKWVSVNSLGELEGIIRLTKRNKADELAEEGSKKHITELPQHIILAGLSGSLAYGLEHTGYVDPDSGEDVPASDVDIRGVFVTPTVEVLSLEAHQKLALVKAEDTVFNEIEKFIELCLKSNPERLEMLATSRKNGYKVVSSVREALQQPELRPSKEQRQSLAGPLGEQLILNQDIFVSKHLIKAYGNYAKQQLYRVESKAQRRTKPAMHLIRLMLTGIRALKTGQIDCDMREHRDALMAIRRGEMSIEDAFKWHAQLEVEFAKAIDSTKLPDEPNHVKANQILLEARRMYLDWS